MTDMISKTTTNISSHASLPTRVLGAFALISMIAVAAAGCAVDGTSHPDPDDGDESAEAIDQSSDELAVAGKWELSPSTSTITAQQRRVTPDEARQGQCETALTPGAQRLRQHILARFPRSVVTRVSPVPVCRPIRLGERTSVHATGRALDIYVDPDPAVRPEGNSADNGDGDPVANYLAEVAPQWGIQRIIWDRAIWGPGESRTRDYSNAADVPHHNHLHVEITVAASR
jgi:hypothetical protein